MATIDETINNFLRDAQYRIAELSVSIEEKRKEGYSHDDELWLRSQLILWMDMIYDPRGGIYDGYNYLESWTDREIQAECEYLRKLSGMAHMPLLTFAGYSPQIRQIITGDSGSATFPYGNINDILVYTSAGNTPVATPFPQIGGMTTETIAEYFN